MEPEPVGETLGKGKAGISCVKRLHGSCPLERSIPGLGLLATRPSFIDIMRLFVPLEYIAELVSRWLLLGHPPP
jgi:hypothetical protein